MHRAYKDKLEFYCDIKVKSESEISNIKLYNEGVIVLNEPIIFFLIKLVWLLEEARKQNCS